MGISTVTVVGAGNMGSGIAQAFAAGGCRVYLVDVADGAVGRAIDRIRGGLQRRVAAGKMKAADVEALLARLAPAGAVEEAAPKSDLVIEAIVEDLPAKQQLFAGLDAVCGPEVVLATNTSSFRVSDIASATARPDRVVGLHFFFPAAVNALVEVIAGPATSPAAEATAWAAAEMVGKLPIQASDSPGFCVNRFFVPWLNEASRMLEEGLASAASIDAAAREAFGIAMGPFALMNATGPPIALHSQQTLHEAFGPLYEPSRALAARVEDGGPWPLGDGAEPAPQEVRDRLLATVFLIAAQLREEDVASARDADLGALTGLRWARGPFQMMNDLGLAEVLRLVEPFANRWGVPIPARLVELADGGGKWELPLVQTTWLDEGRIAQVKLDRPERRNSLAPEMLEALARALDELEAGEPRAVILTGRGRVFAAGADIPRMVDLGSRDAARYTAQGARVLERLEALPAPVVMAINGVALGGGLELALAGDILLAARGVRLGLPEVALGLHPGWGGTQRLPRRIGLGRAKDLVLTGRSIDADEAFRLGLVNEVVDAGQLAQRALDVARTIAGHAPLAVGAAKRSMNRAMATDLDLGLELERESVALLFDTEDKKEGLTAFLERRAPDFRGA